MCIRDRSSHYEKRGLRYLETQNMHLAISDFEENVRLDPQHLYGWALLINTTFDVAGKSDEYRQFVQGENCGNGMVLSIYE